MVNDRHPAGDPFPADPGAEYSYAPYETANYEQSAYGSYGNAGYAEGGESWSTGAYGTSAAAHYGDGDPLFGAVPGGQDLSTGTYPSAPYGSYETGAYDTTGYDGHGYDAHGYGTGTYDAHAYGTGSYDATGWDGNSWDGGNGWDGSGAGHQSVGFIPHQPGPDQAEHGWSTPAEGTAQWDVNAFEASGWDGTAYGHADTSAAAQDSGGYDAGTYEATPYDAAPYGTGAYDDSGWAHGYATPGAADGEAAFHDQPTASFDAYDAHPEADAGTYDAEPYPADAYDADAYPADAYPADPYDADAYGEPVPVPGSEAEPEPGAAVHGPPGRSRRRSPKPRRSALLTVAAPSVAVLGVAGIAAASVLPSPDEETAQAAAPDTTEVKVSPANNKLDTQLAGLREAGDDFADRASRTQERIDLKKRQEAERKRKAAEAARREALRPKFALPVEGAGISAYFGQAGINWMSVHTGLDFPVSYGTPVKAATDGTVRTQWNPAYGNMMIVTSPDGTETWYCHLSSTRIRSGSVQAGDVIGYSGNSGNSTGPHLHFEVRPGGGSAIDPLAWFRSHGLEPV